MINPISSVTKLFLLKLLKLYKYLISPLLGNHCRFHPTCSIYAQKCLQKETLFRALLKIIIRVGCCFPGGEKIWDKIKTLKVTTKI